MDSSGIKVKVQVDIDDLDIAIGKAKELNRELDKIKASIGELTNTNLRTEIIVCLTDDEAQRKEELRNVMNTVAEALKRECRGNHR